MNVPRCAAARLCVRQVVHGPGPYNGKVHSHGGDIGVVCCRVHGSRKGMQDVKHNMCVCCVMLLCVCPMLRNY